MKLTRPTVTSLVVEALKAQDDFMDYRMLMQATNCNMNQVTAATHHLRKCNAIDCVISPDGVAWWYPTPDKDNRLFAVNEKAPEVRPRKRRKYSPRKNNEHSS